MNINKYLASVGIASRRKINELVGEGKVKVNDQIATLGQSIDPQKDKIFLHGQEIGSPQHLVYIMLNKPKGVVSTVSDEMGRKTVLDIVKIKERIYPVGRLDQDSEGLMLLTNDGQLANYLTHPRYEVLKTYEVWVLGGVNEYNLNRLRQGVKLKEGVTSPAQVSVLHKTGQKSLLEITLKEGWNREIRRMCGVLNLEVISLKRIALGPLTLGDLKSGEFRNLNEEEVDKLKANSLLTTAEKKQ